VFLAPAAACTGDGLPQTATVPLVSPTPEPVASVPPSAPPVVGIVNGFLVVDANEAFPAFLPCTFPQAEEDLTVPFPLTIGRLPEGAVESSTSSKVCPDGTILWASRGYSLASDPEGDEGFFAVYRRATEAYPIVLADPVIHRIEPVSVNGGAGVLVEPLKQRDIHEIVRLVYWVSEADSAPEMPSPYAYVEVGFSTDVDAPASELIKIAESITHQRQAGHGAGGEPPPDLVEVLDSLPMYSGAALVQPLYPHGVSTGTELQISYWVRGNVESVMAFYSSELHDRGWRLEGPAKKETFWKGNVRTVALSRAFVHDDVRLDLSAATTDKDPSRGNIILGLVLEPQ
jgi:hypothetical protein